jgi:hypothetical protein
MTTNIKTPKDAKEAINMVADSATKAAEDTKVAVDTMVNIATKATEDSKAILVSNQKLFLDSFETWQKYNQTYLDFVIEAMQRLADQSFAFQERLNKMAVETIKRNQALMVEEQETTLEAVEAFQSQFRAASERFTKTFSNISVN